MELGKVSIEYLTMRDVNGARRTLARPVLGVQGHRILTRR